MRQQFQNSLLIVNQVLYRIKIILLEQAPSINVPTILSFAMILMSYSSTDVATSSLGNCFRCPMLIIRDES